MVPFGGAGRSLRSLAVFKRGNRDNKPQSREEPGRETTAKLRRLSWTAQW